jgi:hypothetical protein
VLSIHFTFDLGTPLALGLLIAFGAGIRQTLYSGERVLKAGKAG